MYRWIESNTQLNSEGQLSWNTLEFSEYLSILDDAFDFPKGTSPRVRHRATHDGIVRARKRGVLNDNTALKEIRRAFYEYGRRRTNPYAMWTRIRVAFPHGQAGLRFRADDVSLEIANALPPYMRLTAEQLAHASPLSKKDVPRFAYLIARTSACDDHDAAEDMIHAAGTLISVFNLALRSWNFFGSEQKPEAALLLGPYQHIFKQKAALIEQVSWYNPDFREDFWRTSSGDTKVFKAVRSVRKALYAISTHPLKIEILQVLRLSNEAMESPDLTKRTLRYWSALERLFSTDAERASYDTIIRRATFLESDKEIARAKLNRLLSVRNRYVHWGVSEQGHHQLNQYVADLIRRFLFYIVFNGEDFLDHRELLEMCDLPSDIASLARRRKAIERREKIELTKRHK